jgi:hypothetical protein
MVSVYPGSSAAPDGFYVDSNMQWFGGLSWLKVEADMQQKVIE